MAEFDNWIATRWDNDIENMLQGLTFSGAGVDGVPVQVRFWDYVQNADGSLAIGESRLLVFSEWEPGYRGVVGG